MSESFEDAIFIVDGTDARLHLVCDTILIEKTLSTKEIEEMFTLAQGVSFED